MVRILIDFHCFFDGFRGPFGVQHEAKTAWTSDLNLDPILEGFPPWIWEAGFLPGAGFGAGEGLCAVCKELIKGLYNIYQDGKPPIVMKVSPWWGIVGISCGALWEFQVRRCGNSQVGHFGILR